MNKKTTLAILVLAIAILGGYFLTTKKAVNAPAVENQAVEETKEFISLFEDIDPDKIALISIEEIQWPNSCLGLPQDEEMCAQALVPGYKITLDADGEKMIFRTNRDGSSIRLESRAGKSGQ